jgi:dihydrodipicolinate reductase
MKLIIHGMGQMGQILLKEVQNNTEIEVVALVDAQYTHATLPSFSTLKAVNIEADVLIDFSHFSLLSQVLDFGKTTQTKLVLATTGYTEADLAQIALASQDLAIFQSYNMSYGIAVIEQMLQNFVTKLIADYDIEIIEKHHNQKIDAPSGTAKLLYKAIAESVDTNLQPVYNRSTQTQKRAASEVGMHAIRGGTIFGEHEIIFAGNDEIIEIKHSALSKKVFAVGSIKAAFALLNENKGLFDNKIFVKDIDSN